MAEGGDLPATQVGSDAECVPQCLPCSKDGSKADATHYCLECLEYMCVACTRCHRRFTATQNHELVEATNEELCSPNGRKPKCCAHPDRDIELYCAAHDMVYCSLCVALDHRSCEGISTIEDAVPADFSETWLQDCQNNLENIQKQFLEMRKMKKDNIQKLLEEKQQVLCNINKVNETELMQVNTLARNTIDELTETCLTLKSELDTDITKMDKTVNDIEAQISRIPVAMTMEKKHQFAELKTGKFKATYSRDVYEGMSMDREKSVRFSNSKELNISFVEANTLGHIQNINGKQIKDNKVKSVRYVDGRIFEWHKTSCCIIDACQLPNGTVIVADSAYNLVKRLNIGYQLKDYFNLEIGIRGVCVCGPRHIAVILVMMGRSVHFIHVGESLSKMMTVYFPKLHRRTNRHGVL